MAVTRGGGATYRSPQSLHSPLHYKPTKTMNLILQIIKQTEKSLNPKLIKLKEELNQSVTRVIEQIGAKQ